MCESVEPAVIELNDVPSIEPIPIGSEETSKAQDTELVSITEAPFLAQSAPLNTECSKTNKTGLMYRLDKEKDKINRTDLYDFNPITNYFFYNRKTEGKKIDEKLIEDDEFINKAYKEFNLKFCEVKIIDCFKTAMFKGQKAPIKLTNEVKEALNLNEKNDDDSSYDFESSSDEAQPKSSKNLYKAKNATKRSFLRGSKGKRRKNSKKLNDKVKIKTEPGQKLKKK